MRVKLQILGASSQRVYHPKNLFHYFFWRKYFFKKSTPENEFRAIACGNKSNTKQINKNKDYKHLPIYILKFCLLAELSS
jgi:hypothetical protein